MRSIFSRRTIVVLSCVGFFFIGKLSRADDWPQWMGPDRNDRWSETGIISSIPDDGLPVLWRSPVNLGYSGPAVANGKVYLTDYQKESGEVQNSPDGRIELEGLERVLCCRARGCRLRLYQRAGRLAACSDCVDCFLQHAQSSLA